MYKVSGSYSTATFEYLNIAVVPCQNSSSNITCLPIDKQQNYFNKINFGLYFLNSYFDTSEFEQPVKQFIDETVYFKLVATQNQLADFFV